MNATPGTGTEDHTPTGRLRATICQREAHVEGNRSTLTEALARIIAKTPATTRARAAGQALLAATERGMLSTIRTDALSEAMRMHHASESARLGAPHAHPHPWMAPALTHIEIVSGHTLLEHLADARHRYASDSQLEDALGAVLSLKRLPSERESTASRTLERLAERMRSTMVWQDETLMRALARRADQRALIHSIKSLCTRPGTAEQAHPGAQPAIAGADPGEPMRTTLAVALTHHLGPKALNAGDELGESLAHTLARTQGGRTLLGALDTGTVTWHAHTGDEHDVVGLGIEAIASAGPPSADQETALRHWLGAVQRRGASPARAACGDGIDSPIATLVEYEAFATLDWMRRQAGPGTKTHTSITRAMAEAAATATEPAMQAFLDAITHRPPPPAPARREPHAEHTHPPAPTPSAGQGPAL